MNLPDGIIIVSVFQLGSASSCCTRVKIKGMGQGKHRKIGGTGGGSVGRTVAIRHQRSVVRIQSLAIFCSFIHCQLYSKDENKGKRGREWPRMGHEDSPHIKHRNFLQKNPDIAEKFVPICCCSYLTCCSSYVVPICTYTYIACALADPTFRQSFYVYLRRSS